MTTKTDYTFDDVARTERYFTGTLLPHILMSDNFSGLKKLFGEVFGQNDIEDLANEFEVVSELDPLRDGSKYNDFVRKQFEKYKRVAVPDLFLRWGSKILIIEAKFFTNPPVEEVEEQINDQMEAIKLIRSETLYKQHSISFCALTIQEQRKKRKDINYLTWGDIISLFKGDEKLADRSVEYALKTIKSAMERAGNEFIEVDYEIVPSLDDLLRRLPELIKERKIYVGFTGGEKALNECDIQSLRNRGHYKVSASKLNNKSNWLPVDKVLSRYIRLMEDSRPSESQDD